MSNLLLYALRLNLWRKSLSRFFKDTTGYDPSPRQREFLDDLTDLDIERAIVCSARGTGKTISLAVLSLWYSIVLPHFYKIPFKTLILSGSLEQSQQVYRFIMDCIRNDN